jgi:hypothetical protein
MKFREYQVKIINTAQTVLLAHRFVYLSMEVRTGKTLTALGVAEKLGINNLLFVTKKKAIGSIEADYKKLMPNYPITVINYESLHKVEGEFDFVVLDEAHTMGAYPKPSKRTKLIKEIIQSQNPYVVLMSGTPTPESFSQIYHQVYACLENPFNQYKTFYKFAKEYVNVTQRMFHSMPSNNYDDGKPEIIDMMKPYMISYTQKEAGFKSQIKEHVLKVKMSDLTYRFVKEMSEHRLIEGKKTREVILGDTNVKKMSKIHQLFSGTVKLENGTRMITDLSKARFIRTEFKNKKIAVFYKFKAEYEALKQVYKDGITDDLNEFNTTSKNIALQIASGREGISLKKADCLVYYNIDFSALSYWQSRDRMTTKDSTVSDVYWIFAEKGIETRIYKTVINKKDYTLKHFEKDLLSL